jgi:ribosomal protein L7/L12
VANDSDFAAALEPAKQALAHGNKIDAIRLARQATGMSLPEAQELIALWEKKK